MPLVDAEVPAVQVARLARGVKKVAAIDQMSRAMSPEEEEVARMDKKYESIDLWAVADQLRNNVKVRDRMYHFKVYPKTCIGFELSKTMIKLRIADNVAEADYVGNLLVTAGLLMHCVERHDYETAYLFYRFAVDAVDRVNFDHIDIKAVEKAMWNEMPLRSRDVQNDRLGSFSGCELVSFLVDHGWCRNRGEALNLAQVFLTSGIIQSHSSAEQVKDDNSLFGFPIGFTPAESADSISSLSENSLKKSFSLGFKGLLKGNSLAAGTPRHQQIEDI